MTKLNDEFEKDAVLRALGCIHGHDASEIRYFTNCRGNHTFQCRVCARISGQKSMLKRRAALSGERVS